MAALGEQVTKHAVGDRVTLEPGVPCGRCRECRAGRYNLCPDVVFFATPPVDGAFTNYVTIHEDFAFALPDSVSDDVGALMEPLSVAVWACRKGGVTAGDRVLVTGAGPIGLLCQQVARRSARRPSRSPTSTRTGWPSPRAPARRARCAPASTSRARWTSSSSARGTSPRCRPGSRRCARPGSRSSSAWGRERPPSSPWRRSRAARSGSPGTFRYANTYPTAIALAAGGRVDLEAIITGHYTLDETEQALRAGREEPASVKVVVHP